MTPRRSIAARALTCCHEHRFHELRLISSLLGLQVKEGGLVFFRESCFKQSGDKQRKSNPTHYRNPRNYFAIWEATEIEQPDGRFARYELVSCKCVDTYVRLKGNQNQICWKWRKVPPHFAVHVGKPGA